MNSKHLILIGYRATGKTSLAGKLAENLACAAVDTDLFIEQQTGMSIADIFAVHGEEHFRNLESRVLDELMCRENAHVFATGGGLPIRESNRNRIKQSGFVVWLKASPETIHHRMSTDPRNTATRPGLTKLAPKEEILHLLEKRTPLYRETAHAEVETDTRPLDDIADEIHRLYRKWINDGDCDS